MQTIICPDCYGSGECDVRLIRGCGPDAYPHTYKGICHTCMGQTYLYLRCEYCDWIFDDDDKWVIINGKHFHKNECAVEMLNSKVYTASTTNHENK